MTDEFDGTGLSRSRITNAMEEAEDWSDDFPVDDNPVSVYRLRVPNAVEVTVDVRDKAYALGRAHRWSWNPVSMEPPLDTLIWVWGPQMTISCMGSMRAQSFDCNDGPELAYYTSSPTDPFVSATQVTGHERDWFTGVTHWCVCPAPPIPENNVG